MSQIFGQCSKCGGNLTNGHICGSMSANLNYEALKKIPCKGVGDNNGFFEVNKPNNDMPDVSIKQNLLDYEAHCMKTGQYQTAQLVNNARAAIVLLESHIQQLEARHQEEMDSALAKQREEIT